MDQQPHVIFRLSSSLCTISRNAFTVTDLHLTEWVTLYLPCFRLELPHVRLCTVNLRCPLFVSGDFSAIKLPNLRQRLIFFSGRTLLIALCHWPPFPKSLHVCFSLSPQRNHLSCLSLPSLSPAWSTPPLSPTLRREAKLCAHAPDVGPRHLPKELSHAAKWCGWCYPRSPTPPTFTQSLPLPPLCPASSCLASCS